MRKLAVLTLVCAAGAGGWLLGRQQAPVPASASTEVGLARPDIGGDVAPVLTEDPRLHSERRQVETAQAPVAPMETASTVPDQPRAKIADRSRALGADFLPYPNGGEQAFRSKYAALDVIELGGIMLELREKLNSEADKLFEERYENGLADERIYSSSDEANDHPHEVNPPQGLGKVWPGERASLQPDGSMKHCKTFLTEAEHPVLFAHQAEYEWVVHQHWVAKKQQAQGH